MSNSNQNLNPFSFQGYIGRKFYFLIGLFLGLFTVLMQFIFCKHIYKSILYSASMQTDTKIITILQNPTLPKSELIMFCLILLFGIIVGFNNNFKRFYDITADKKVTLLYTLLMVVLPLGSYFVSYKSPLYMILSLILFIAACMLIFVKGKFVIAEENLVSQPIDGKIETKKVVRFWRRLVAYVVDSTVILKVAAALIGISGAKLWYEIGAYGIFIGFTIYVLYFGVMNSNICKGQTLGKKLLNVKVVDSNGQYLTINKSLLRALVLFLCLIAGPAILETAINILPATESWNPWCYGSIILLYALLAAFLYLFMFNVKTRQTIHDLIVKSYVVINTFEGKLEDNKTSVTNIIISLFVFLFLAGFLFAVVRKYVPFAKKDFAFVNQINKELKTEVMWTNNVVYPANERVLKVLVRTSDINDDELANKVGMYLWEKYPDISNVKKVEIILVKSYTLGLITDKVTKTYKINGKN